MSKNRNYTSFTKDLQFISTLNLKQYQPWPATSNWLFTWLQWTTVYAAWHDHLGTRPF